MNPGPIILNGDKTTCPCENAIRNSLHISCVECEQKWHVRCVGLEGITEVPLRKITSWNCPICYTLPEILKAQEDKEEGILTKVRKELQDMETRLSEKITKSEPIPARAATYAEKLQKNMNDIGLQQRKGNEMVKALLHKSKQTDDPAEIEKQERICIVRKPTDSNVRSSRDIRKVINNKFPGMVMRQARNTVGGSILIEFDDEDSANHVIQDWDVNLFGGNAGIVKYRPQHTAGIIKQVEDLEETQIEQEIKAQFPDSRIELFTREDRFTGTVKIIFKNEGVLNKAIQEKCKLNGQVYIVDIFTPKPKVIKCNTCQRFGHVSRVCRNKNNPVCGKCKGKHETMNCEIPKEEYKCVHCDGNHITGSYTCEKVREKLEEILNRGNGY